MVAPRKALIAANAFGSSGYISVIFQWFWTSLLLLYPTLQDDRAWFWPPTTQQQVTYSAPAITMSPLAVIIVLMITVAIMGLTVVVVARLPKKIGKTGQRATQLTTAAIIPLITHHKKIAKKRLFRLSRRLTLAMKLTIILLPLIGTWFAPTITELPGELAWVIALFCAIISIICFGSQELIAHWRHIQLDQLW